MKNILQTCVLAIILFFQATLHSIITEITIVQHKKTNQIIFLCADVHCDHREGQITNNQQHELLKTIDRYNQKTSTVCCVEDIISLIIQRSPTLTQEVNAQKQDGIFNPVQFAEQLQKEFAQCPIASLAYPGFQIHLDEHVLYPQNKAAALTPLMYLHAQLADNKINTHNAEILRSQLYQLEPDHNKKKNSDYRAELIRTIAARTAQLTDNATLTTNLKKLYQQLSRSVYPQNETEKLLCMQRAVDIELIETVRKNQQAQAIFLLAGIKHVYAVTDFLVKTKDFNYVTTYKNKADCSDKLVCGALVISPTVLLRKVILSPLNITQTFAHFEHNRDTLCAGTKNKGLFGYRMRRLRYYFASVASLCSEVGAKALEAYAKYKQAHG